jgi:5-methyltetrahydropteroyltriglutamate--homocysteine methyltransferase
VSNGQTLLPTTVVGSYALPAWLYAADDWIKRDLFGPTDIAETLNDAVDRAILISSEPVSTSSPTAKCADAAVQSFANRITGLRNIGPPRKVGEVGLDLEPVSETTGRLAVEHGFGIVEEFRCLKAKADGPIKVTVPGPFAITSFLKPVEYYKDRPQLAHSPLAAVFTTEMWTLRGLWT